MSTCHEDGVRQLAEHHLATDPAAGMVYMEYLRMIREGYYGAFADVILQSSARYPQLDIYDAYAFARERGVHGNAGSEPA